MKYTHLLILFVGMFFAQESIRAQYYTSAISVTAGYVQDGLGTNINFDYKINKFDYLEFGLQGNFGNLTYKEIDIPAQLIAFNTGFYYDIIRNNRRFANGKKGFAFCLGAGFQIGSEILNEGETTLNENSTLNFETKQIIFGSFIGANIDYFLNSTIAIAFKITETYHFNSNIGSLSPYAGLGVKIVLN